MVPAIMSSEHDDLITPLPPGGSRDSDPLLGRVSDVRVMGQLEHAAGDVIVGKYRLVSLIGEGGMGAVWRARSLALDVDVAIKLVRRDAATSDASERLLREARAAASIGHPAIVRVFDFGLTEANEPYLVMELLSGESLGDWLDREQRISATVAVQMILPVISALAAAHAQGIIHRDIKPENIFIAHGEGDTRLPKLLDFGIVKFSQPRGGRVLTEIGMLMGSPEYMSPEQAEGRAEIDDQTDVWSISVVLYELITGRRPFSGSHSGAVLISIFRDTPVPTTTLAAGDDELWSIIERGLQKKPAARWDGMRALGAALGAWAIERGIETDATGASIARHWLSGSRGSLVAYTPQAEPVRTAAARTHGFETADQGAPSVRSVTRTPSHPDGELPSSGGSRPRTILIAAAAAIALVAAIIALNIPRSPSTEAVIVAPMSPAVIPTAVAPSPPEPSVVAAPASVVLAAAVLPPVVASSARVAPRVAATSIPNRPAGSTKPSSRGPKTSMPLPAAPNF
jgi:serine/threonine-protein kinase